MRAAVASLYQRLAADFFGRHGLVRMALVALPHIAALGIMAWSEYTLPNMAAFLFTWGPLNFFWLTLLRRPLIAGLLSLTMLSVLVLLSQLKYHVLLMTANFVDLMIIDTDTVSFLFTIFPTLRWIVALCVVLLVPLLVLAWWADPFRVRRPAAAALAIVCLGGITAVGLEYPLPPSDAW